MDPILHIGFPKTATTWFQKSFYPSVKNSYLVPKKLIMREMILPYYGKFDQQNFQNLIQANDFKKIILCEERLTGSIDTMGFSEFIQKVIADRLKAVFPSAQIVLFIRNQPDAIASAYFQYIYNGGTLNINKYLTARENHDGLNRLKYFSYSFFDYERTIELYLNLFGSENIHIFLYEDFLKDNSSFIKNYADRLSLDIEIQDLDFKKLNQRQGYFNTTLIRQMNRIFPPNNHLLKPIRKILLSGINRSLPVSDNTSVKILKSSNCKRLENYFKELNKKLTKYVDADKLEEYGYI